MQDIVVTSVVVIGLLYHVIKYKLVLDPHESWGNIVLSVVLAVAVSAYAVYIRLGETIDARYTTLTILIAIGGVVLDFVANVFPERGAWAAAVALVLLVKESHAVSATTTRGNVVGIVLIAVVLLLLCSAEVRKRRLRWKRDVSPDPTYL